MQVREVWVSAIICAGLGSTGYAQNDCNLNGLDDTAEIVAGALADCNGDGVPDVCQGVFVQDRAVTVSGVPLSLASADFDADGTRDMVYADRGANTAVVLLGSASGTYTPHTFTTGVLPVWLAIADLNGDMRPDLAVANAASNNVTILINTGQGGEATFAAPETLAVGLTPTFILAVDLDGDGDQDLVITQYGGQTLRKLINNGQGGFTSGGDQAVGFGPVSIAAADFDSDGKPDLAVANETSNNLSVLLSGPTSPPPTVASFGSPVSLSAADFDGDNRIDLAVANFNSSRVLILHNNGDGSFSAGQELLEAANPSFVLATDVNGDGRRDLLVIAGASVTDATQSMVLLFLGRGDGTFVASGRGAIGSANFNSLVFEPLDGVARRIAALDQAGSRVVFLRSEGFACAQPPPVDEQPPAPGACGAGVCGAGGATLVPLTLAGLLLMRTGGAGRNRWTPNRS